MTFSRRPGSRFNRGRIATRGGGASNIVAPATADEGEDPLIVYTGPDVGDLELRDVSSDPDTDVATGVGDPWEANYPDVTPGTRRLQWFEDGTDTSVSGIAPIVVTPEAPTLELPVADDYLIGSTVDFRATGTVDGFDANTTSIEFIRDDTDAVVATANTETAGDWDASWDTTGEDEVTFNVFPRRHYEDIAGVAGSVDGDPVAIGLVEGGYDDAAVRLIVDAFLADGTWTRPSLETFWGLTGDANRAQVELWAAGGGGLTNTGGGGGGAYSRMDNLDVSGAASFAIAGLGAVAANTNGADATFATTLCVAQGGRSQGNGGAGGATASGTGDVKFAGGAGPAGTGNQLGGAGAGSESAAVTTTPGEPGGGHPLSNNSGFAPGAGGGSSAAAGFGGVKGIAAVAYQITAGVGYARLRGFRKWRAVANGTSHVVSMPTGIVAGELLVAIANCNSGAHTLTATGWTKLGQQDNLAVFYKTAAGSDTLTVTQSSSGRTQTIVMRIANAGVPEWTASAQAAAANGDPPSHTYSGGSQPGLVFALYGCTGRTTPTAYPATYDTGIWVPAHGNNGTVMLAMKEVTGTAADPGAFTINSGTMVVATLMVPHA